MKNLKKNIGAILVTTTAMSSVVVANPLAPIAAYAAESEPISAIEVADNPDNVGIKWEPVPFNTGKTKDYPELPKMYYGLDSEASTRGYAVAGENYYLKLVFEFQTEDDYTGINLDDSYLEISHLDVYEGLFDPTTLITDSKNWAQKIGSEDAESADQDFDASLKGALKAYNLTDMFGKLDTSTDGRKVELYYSGKIAQTPSYTTAKPTVTVYFTGANYFDGLQSGRVEIPLNAGIGALSVRGSSLGNTVFIVTQEDTPTTDGAINSGAIKFSDYSARRSASTTIARSSKDYVVGRTYSAYSIYIPEGLSTTEQAETPSAVTINDDGTVTLTYTTGTKTGILYTSGSDQLTTTNVAMSNAPVVNISETSAVNGSRYNGLTALNDVDGFSSLTQEEKNQFYKEIISSGIQDGKSTATASDVTANNAIVVAKAKAYIALKNYTETTGSDYVGNIDKDNTYLTSENVAKIIETMKKLYEDGKTTNTVQGWEEVVNQLKQLHDNASTYVELNKQIVVSEEKAGKNKDKIPYTEATEDGTVNRKSDYDSAYTAATNANNGYDPESTADLATAYTTATTNLKNATDALDGEKNLQKAKEDAIETLKTLTDAFPQGSEKYTEAENAINSQNTVAGVKNIESNIQTYNEMTKVINAANQKAYTNADPKGSKTTAYTEADATTEDPTTGDQRRSDFDEQYKKLTETYGTYKPYNSDSAVPVDTNPLVNATAKLNGVDILESAKNAAKSAVHNFTPEQKTAFEEAIDNATTVEEVNTYVQRADDLDSLKPSIANKASGTKYTEASSTTKTPYDEAYNAAKKASDEWTPETDTSNFDTLKTNVTEAESKLDGVKNLQDAKKASDEVAQKANVTIDNSNVDESTGTIAQVAQNTKSGLTNDWVKTLTNLSETQRTAITTAINAVPDTTDGIEQLEKIISDADSANTLAGEVKRQTEEVKPSTNYTEASSTTKTPYDEAYNAAKKASDEWTPGSDTSNFGTLKTNVTDAESKLDGVKNLQDAKDKAKQLYEELGKDSTDEIENATTVDRIVELMKQAVKDEVDKKTEGKVPNLTEADQTGAKTFVDRSTTPTDVLNSYGYISSIDKLRKQIKDSEAETGKVVYTAASEGKKNAFDSSLKTAKDIETKWDENPSAVETAKVVNATNDLNTKTAELDGSDQVKDVLEQLRAKEYLTETQKSNLEEEVNKAASEGKLSEFKNKVIELADKQKELKDFIEQYEKVKGTELYTGATEETRQAYDEAVANAQKYFEDVDSFDTLTQASTNLTTTTDAYNGLVAQSNGRNIPWGWIAAGVGAAAIAGVGLLALANNETDRAAEEQVPAQNDAVEQNVAQDAPAQNTPVQGARGALAITGNSAWPIFGALLAMIAGAVFFIFGRRRKDEEA